MLLCHEAWRAEGWPSFPESTLSNRVRRSATHVAIEVTYGSPISSLSWLPPGMGYALAGGSTRRTGRGPTRWIGIDLHGAAGGSRSTRTARSRSSGLPPAAKMPPRPSPSAPGRRPRPSTPVPLPTCCADPRAEGTTWELMPSSIPCVPDGALMLGPRDGADGLRLWTSRQARRGPPQWVNRSTQLRPTANLASHGLDFRQASTTQEDLESLMSYGGEFPRSDRGDRRGELVPNDTGYGLPRRSGLAMGGATRVPDAGEAVVVSVNSNGSVRGHKARSAKASGLGREFGKAALDASRVHNHLPIERRRSDR